MGFFMLYLHYVDLFLLCILTYLQHVAIIPEVKSMFIKSVHNNSTILLMLNILSAIIIPEVKILK